MSDMQDFNTQIINEFRANDGKVGGMFEGASLLILHTKGAKTGAEREHPLMFLDLDGHRYVFASKGGAPTNPVWFTNLVANPVVTVEVPGSTYEATATPLEDSERARVYDYQASHMPQFAEYAANTDRVIPVVELVPR
jgi:deazaflavin-dependent oxidoreductase (nitroreductase family)